MDRDWSRSGSNRIPGSGTWRSYEARVGVPAEAGIHFQLLAIAQIATRAVEQQVHAIA